MNKQIKLNKTDLIFRKIDVLSELKVLFKTPKTDLLDLIEASGLKGRGGAGFLTGRKWRMCYFQKEPLKYVVCNADEGEPGTFKDRQILSDVPEKVLAGMALCAYILGAKEGIIYLRGEYSFLSQKLHEEILEFNQKLKKHLDFNIRLVLGSGAYVCGEETALLESLEGKRGEPRNKPPFPVSNGYLNNPTVINNVETLVYTFVICKNKGQVFSFLGTSESRGSKVFSVSGDSSKPGIYELELGMTLDKFVNEFGDGDTKAVQIGGASGECIPRKFFSETIIGFEGVPTGGAMMLFNNSRSMYNVLHNYLDFFAEESCGQCTPCRIGCQQLLQGVEAVKIGDRGSEYIEVLVRLAKNMMLTSKCGLGVSVGKSFISIVKHFKEEIIY